jgi:hypothetical protein
VAAAEQKKSPGGKDLNTRLKELINVSPAMVFIKVCDQGMTATQLGLY